jgi:hypothetical protein
LKYYDWKQKWRINQINSKSLCLKNTFFWDGIFGKRIVRISEVRRRSDWIVIETFTRFVVFITNSKYFQTWNTETHTTNNNIKQIENETWDIFSEILLIVFVLKTAIILSFYETKDILQLTIKGSWVKIII